MDKLTKVFNFMRQNKKVRITDEFRKYWGNCHGSWFMIRAINDDETIKIQDMGHGIFVNAPLSAIVI